MPLKTYTSDDGFDSARLPIFFLIALPGCTLLAILYQVLGYYMPCMGWVTAVLMLGYAGGQLFVLNFAGELARNRNMWVHLAASAIVVGFAYYVCWSTFFTLLLQASDSDAGIVWNPLEIAEYIPLFADVGYTTGSFGSSSTNSGSSISGWFLWFCWVIEALVILVAPPLISWSYVNNPFFPASNSWGKKRKIEATYRSETVPATAANLLDDEAFDWMRDLQPGKGIGAIGFEFIEHPDETMAYMTVTRGVEKTEDKKKVIKQDTFAEFIELGPAQRKRIDQLLADMDARDPYDEDAAMAAAEAANDAADLASGTSNDAAPAAAAPAEELPAPTPEAALAEPAPAPDPYAIKDRTAAAKPAAPPPTNKRPPAPGPKNIGDEWDK